MSTPGSALHGYGNEQRRAVARGFYSERESLKHYGAPNEIAVDWCNSCLKIFNGNGKECICIPFDPAGVDICALAGELPSVGLLECP